MVAGTLMLSDSVNRSFDDIFAEANAGIDVSVRARVEVEGGFAVPEAGTAVPESLLAEVESADGVEQASGSIGDAISIAILDENGDRIGPPDGGPPHIAYSVQPEPFTPFSYIDGGPPAADNEVAIDSFTADEEGYEVGQDIPITGARGLTEYTLSGIARFGSGVRSAVPAWPSSRLRRRRRITDKPGEFDEIAVEAADGVTPEELRDRLTALLPETVEVKTGEQIASEDSQDIKEGFSFLTTALLIFAGITVFVGAFLIFNTFAITVAQRTREFGMLRTVGASSRQVLGSVIAEAAVLGLLASAVGVIAGAGFVKVLLAVFKALGFELPQSGLPIEPRTVAVALAVGIDLDPGLGARPGAAGDARDPDGGAQRERSDREPGRRPPPGGGRLRAWPSRDRRPAARPVRNRGLHLGARSDGRRSGPAVHRDRDARRPSGGAARIPGRAADRAPPWRYREARP